MSYSQIRRAMAGKLWYLHPEKMQEMLAILDYKLSGGTTAPEVLKPIRASSQAVARTQNGGQGAIAVIPIVGVICHRSMADMWGFSWGTSTQSLSMALRRAVDDPGVSSIVLDVDSPGGDVEGVDELASEIYAARKQKPITAVSNCLCASAAYYLASQATEIVVSPSSLTGSIGVYVMHADLSAALDNEGVKMTMIKYGDNKGEGNPYEALSDPAREHLQDLVTTYGRGFEKAVARGRGLRQDQVHDKFGQGRVFDAKTAVRLGMADRVGTLADVFALSTSARGRQAQFSEMRRKLIAAGGGASRAAAEKKTRELEFARMRHEIAMLD